MKKGKLESRDKRDPLLFIANCVWDLRCDLEKSTNNSKPRFTCLWSKYKVIVTSCFQGPWVWVGSSHVTYMHVSWAWLSLYGTKRHVLRHDASAVANTTHAAPGCKRSREASFLPPTHQISKYLPLPIKPPKQKQKTKLHHLMEQLAMRVIFIPVKDFLQIKIWRRKHN